MSDERLSNHVESLERLLEEKQGIADDIKDRFASVKGEGYDVLVVKTIIARRAKERQLVEEFDQLIVTYEEALS